MERKTQAIGPLPLAKLQKSREWKEYQENSRAFTLQRIKTQESKEILKTFLRKHSQALADVENLDFTVAGNNLNVFTRIGRTPRRSHNKEIDFT